MNEYLKQTEHAVRSLLDLINEDAASKERGRIENLTFESLYLEEENVFHEQDVEDFLSLEGLDPVQVFLAEKFLSDSKGRIVKKNTEIKELKIKLEAYEISINALSTAVMQIARQGLSIFYSSDRSRVLASSPNVRAIGGVPIQEIIWDGRNHAIHYEESPSHTPITRQLFEKLERQYGRRFSLEKNPHKSLAGALISLLGWDSYNAYLHDMEKLLCE